MPVDEEFIRELTRMVWSTVVGIEAEEGPPATLDAEQITSSVDISGAWEGTISLSFSRMLGNRLAAAILKRAESDTTPSLVRDTLGELANVIGGNVKGILPGPCKLSLPRVEAEASNPAMYAFDQRLWFDCEGQPFSVTVRSHASELRSAS